MRTNWVCAMTWCFLFLADSAAWSAASEPSRSSVPAPGPADEAPHVYFSCEFAHPVDPLDSFPLQVGTRWTYQRTTRDPVGPDLAMITVRWIEEVEVVAHHDLSEGKLVLRKTSVHDISSESAPSIGTTEREWFRQVPNQLNPIHYLIQGNYMFEVSQFDIDVERLEWLRDRFPSSGDRSRTRTPSFFFPLDKVEVWAPLALELEALEQARRFEKGLGPAPNPGNYFWHMEGRETVVVPYGRIERAARLHYGTQGGPKEVWFAEGIGIVRETVQRRLDFLSRETVLVDFALPAAAKAASAPK